MPKIEKYTIGQLRDEQVTKLLFSMSHWPISPARVVSYLSNPNARDDDFVIYLALEDENCIAFRTVFPDQIRGKNEEIRIAWLSGNWVSPAHRGKKLSQLLLAEVIKDWQDRLMFTNYSPVSEHLYLDSQHFSRFIEKKGQRYYFKSPLTLKFASSKLPIKPIVNIADRLLDFFAMVLVHVRTQSQDISGIRHSIDFNSIPETPFPQSMSFRNRNHFKWIVDNPWIEPGEKEERYPFSWKEKGNMVIKKSLLGANGTTDGFVIINIKSQTATVPFFYCKTDACGLKLAATTINELVKLNISQLTVYNASVNQLINAIPQQYIFKKTIIQNYYATNGLMTQLNAPEWYRPEDGDGDVAFV